MIWICSWIRDSKHRTRLVVGEALVVVKVDYEDAAGPLERDHLVLLVLPAHVARVGSEPPVPLLGLVHCRVKVVEMFVPDREIEKDFVE